MLCGQSPDSVLIVVNQSSALSRQIGEYYAQRRHIPASNICRLNASTNEEISRSDFDDQISRPIQNYLRGHNLTEKMLYIVTTAGVPLKIRGNLGMSGEAASVDSELTLLYFDLARPLASRAGRHRQSIFRQDRVRRFAIPISRFIWSPAWPDLILTTSRASSTARWWPAIAENS